MSLQSEFTKKLLRKFRKPKENMKESMSLSDKVSYIIKDEKGNIKQVSNKGGIDDKGHS